MKMKIFLLLFIINLNSEAQNLVPNPSFEDTLGCPVGYPDLDGTCKDWMSFRITPDYMNECSSCCGFYNQTGYQIAKSGQAYAGLGMYHNNLPNSKEQIGVQLINPLVIGNKYYLSFYISTAWNSLLANIATNKLGVLFTTYQYYHSNSSYSLPNNSHFYVDSIITDTISWFHVFTPFIADSAYQFLVIGGFYEDSQIDTLHLPYQVVPQISYYYLDDVCLSTDSMFSWNWTNINEENVDIPELLVFPNPSNGSINIHSKEKIYKIRIYNILGKEITYEKSEGKFSITISNLSKGMYFIKVKTSSHEIIKKVQINF